MLAISLLIYFQLTSKHWSGSFPVTITMFSDFNSKVTGFESCPDTERIVNDRSSQTSDLKTSTQGTQTTTSQSSGAQAAPEVSLQLADADSYDVNNLLKFLNRVLPHLEEELKSYNNSSDLKFSENDTELSNCDNQEGSEQRQKTVLKPDFCREKIVSCLSWNSSNVMLAVAYTEKNHEGWCFHETSVGLYNTGKPLFEKDPPVQILKVSGCVRYIRFHDEIPSLLAGGLYTGEVIVWDLKNDNEVLMINEKGSGDEAPHVDVITFLTWRDDNGLWLVTAGRDGRIILWKVSATNQTYEVYKRFLILKQHIATAAQPNEHLEILHMDFQLSSNYFVVACDGGNIFYCSLARARPQTSFPQYQDPFLRSYKPRKGVITYISCCNNLFASCGTDSEVHVFKYDQETPVVKIHTDYPIIGVQWDSIRELISWGGSVVESHNIKDSNMKKLLCEIEGSISTVALRSQSIKYNRKFAVGNQTGEVVILKEWIN